VSKIISLKQLKALIKLNYSPNEIEEDLLCVCTTDIMFEIEQIKKDKKAGQILNNIRTEKTGLHYCIDRGTILALDLDKKTIEDGLFFCSNSYVDENLKLWEEPSNRNIHPEQSARLVIFKCYDEIFQTDLHINCLEEYNR
jgi:hypothetical protein